VGFKSNEISGGIISSVVPLNVVKTYTCLAVSIIGIALFSAAQAATAAIAQSEGGEVYVMTNKAKGNSVLAYQRAPDGTLTFVQESPTQGWARA
jgi:hypothetical protein